MKLKPFSDLGEVLKTLLLVWISVLLVATIAAFFLGKHWSDGNYLQLLFYSTSTSNASFVPISSNVDLSIDVTSLISNQTLTPTPSPPSSPPATYGIIEKNGTMTFDFEVSEYEFDLSESNDNAPVAPIKVNELGLGFRWGSLGSAMR
ncbi:uncharacterized protein M6B38_125610 [Iris pallida]|uniref:Uncharacterized protein n=1 Tax=Iris pallida TaxID=29817 RepID=A0AAX6GPC2_IRIPA|nr:uncharacterized protein M6B38_125610 [Iris pallida]